jgi:DNA-binding NtrC family response regulator
MRPSFLVITRAVDDYWTNVLQKILEPLGELEACKLNEKREVEACLASIPEDAFRMVILDAAALQDEVEQPVSSLRTRYPGLRIVVMTASPTWQRARSAFQAGASDYLYKFLPQVDLQKAFRQILEKPLPPWPR